MNNFYLLIKCCFWWKCWLEHQTDLDYCHDAECSNLDVKDKGRMLIDFIEIKSID